MKPYDIVELRRDIPEHGLKAGATGTVLEADRPGVVLVEFEATDLDEFPVLCVSTKDLVVARAARKEIAA